MVCPQISSPGRPHRCPGGSQQPQHPGPRAPRQPWLSFKAIPSLRGVGKSHGNSWKSPLFQAGEGGRRHPATPTLPADAAGDFGEEKYSPDFNGSGTTLPRDTTPHQDRFQCGNLSAARAGGLLLCPSPGGCPDPRGYLELVTKTLKESFACFCSPQPQKSAHRGCSEDANSHPGPRVLL